MKTLHWTKWYKLFVGVVEEREGAKNRARVYDPSNYIFTITIGILNEIYISKYTIKSKLSSFTK